MQTARHDDFAIRAALPKLGNFQNQQVDLPLLADDDLVELIHHVFGEAGLDLQIGQALFNFVRGFHYRIGTEFRASQPLRTVVK